MNKILLVLKNEIVTAVTRRSFLLVTFGLPLLGFGLFTLVNNVNQSDPEAIKGIFVAPPSTIAEGYVDPSGLIESLPEEMPAELMIKYPSEAAAAAALDAGEIGDYYIIPEDLLQTREIILIKPDFNPLSSDDSIGRIRWMVEVNLLEGDEERAAQINSPLAVTFRPLDESFDRDEENPMTFFIPYITTMLFYVVIFGTASTMLGSITAEKENQVIEVLMLSVSPRQLLTGKLVGRGLTGLLQTMTTVGTGYVLLKLSGRSSPSVAAFDLPPSFLIWGLVFFLLGYSLYAALMAGLGALVPNVREASQATIVLIIPLLIPILSLGPLIEAPHGAYTTALSLFPLTAPVAMMTRLTVGGVPPWQPILAAGLILVTDVLIIRAVAGLFRAQTLLSGQEFKLRLFFKALLGKV